ncbi:MAG TPA: winged helix-turn-helix domain-containing protein [Stellaceae bacterium]|nr:winged helix-turn-helix domain-containing protein [Stellaceae bacterium]
MTRNSSLIGNLEARRHTLGWSLRELSDHCGIDGNLLGDCERGLCAPRFDEIEHWAAALGMRLELVPTQGTSRHGLLVDWDRRSIDFDGSPIRLTPMEWKALERLARTPGELVTHQALFRHLYGDDRQHRAQSTAVRVLITKLRRLLPVRIEARWGQGYVISGLPPSAPEAAIGDAAATPQPNIAETAGEVVAAAAKTAPHDPPPIRRELPNPSDPGMRRVGAPVHLGTRRAEELGVIERFLAERGVTRCPDLTTIQQSPLPTLIWDKMKRKWVRPSVTDRAAG